ncbi:MAG: cytochrome P450 [Myxococcota bacterium]
MMTQIVQTLRRLADRAPKHARPPGPRGLGLLRVHVEFSRNQIGCLSRIANDYGGISSLRLGGFNTYLITEPELIEDVLLRKSDAFHKDALTGELSEVLGQGLLTSEDPVWRRQRKLISPALRRKQIAHYGDTMVARTREMLARWGDGDVVPLHRDIMEATLRIVVETLFGLEFEEDIDEVAGALDAVVEHFHEQGHTLWRFVPEPLPTPMRGKLSGAVARLDATIYGLIDGRRKDPTPGDDLLHHLLVAVDDDGNAMTDRQLRDEVLTMFIAGHETTALAIMYAWHLVSRHPEVAERLREEVDRVLGGRDAVAGDIGKLPYTRAIVQESLRLYPPAWIVGREPHEDVEIGGWTIPSGAQVLLPQSVVHRDPRWYDRPDEFSPERWLDDLDDELPRFAYFPFGGGRRVCIGNYFARMEAMLVVATMAQHVELEPMTDEALRTQPSITQRPAGSIHMRVRHR